MMKNKNFLSDKINKLFYILLIIVIFSNIILIPNISNAASVKQEVKSGINTFPNDYKVLLNKLVSETGHTNWNFYAYYTGIDWNDLVKAEGKCGVNRVYKSYDTIFRCSCGNEKDGYYCANDNATAYFMDPRNFINERNMFQFLDISYNTAIQTRAKVEYMVKKYKVFNYGKSITFIMSDENHKDYKKKVTMTYTDIIMEAAKQSNMSPINIVAKIVQEVGADGSGSTSGTNSTYPNCYNFFNIGGYDGDGVLNALKYAKNKGWNCPYTSIVEGAIFCGRDYINRGQNTSYFFKYDVVGTSILKPGQSQTVDTSKFYFPQYMANIQDPYSQSAILFSAYTNTDSLDENLTFIIPIYNNMPTEVQKPSSLDGKGYDLYFADISSAVNVRSGPSTNYGITTVLYRGDKVAMLKKNYVSGWDQVKLWNGKTAYISNEYLSPLNTKVTGVSFNKTTTNLYIGGVSTERLIATVTPSYATNKTLAWSSSNTNVATVANDGTITAKGAGTTVITCRTIDQGKVANCVVTVTDETKTIKVEDNKLLITPNVIEKDILKYLEVNNCAIYNGDIQVTDNKLATGYKCKIDNNEYFIIKMGEINGDGVINSGDLLIMKKHLLEKPKITDVNKLRASDTNNDNVINSGDLLLLKRFLLGKSNIGVK